MKKAKDYAEEFNAAVEQAKKEGNFNEGMETITKTLNSIAKQFIIEIRELVEQRTPSTSRAILAIFREQEQKWDAFARRTDGMVKTGQFMLILEKASPRIYQWYQVAQLNTLETDEPNI